MRHAYLALLTALSLCFGCSQKNAGEPESSLLSLAPDVSPGETRGASASEVKAFPRGDPVLREKAKAAAMALDEGDLAAQVILSGIDGSGHIPRGMKEILGELRPGGFMLFKYNLEGDAEAVRGFIREALGLAGDIPPFIAVDHEGGSVHRFGGLVSRLPPPLYFESLIPERGKEASLALIHDLAFQSGKELRSLGINLNLAPLAEILDDGNRAFLEDRSYGRDAEWVGLAAMAFMRGMEKAGVACSPKHFPGNAETDPHFARAELSWDRETFLSRISPFAELVRYAEPAAVMLSHVLVPAIDSEYNASLSEVMAEDWLRGRMGFDGIILADDFSMAAVSSLGMSAETAAVRALAAGVDMVMTWPPGLRRTHNSILKALREGVLSRGRLESAAARIIYQKMRFRLFDTEE